MNKDLNKKIIEGLGMIKINNDTTWFVPNRKILNMSILEFVEFERARLSETTPDNPKYKHHYSNDAETKPVNKPVQISFFVELEY